MAQGDWATGRGDREEPVEDGGRREDKAGRSSESYEKTAKGGRPDETEVDGRTEGN